MLSCPAQIVLSPLPLGRAQAAIDYRYATTEAVARIAAALDAEVAADDDDQAADESGPDDDDAAGALVPANGRRPLWPVALCRLVSRLATGGRAAGDLGATGTPGRPLHVLSGSACALKPCHQ
jgi:hypothetical protein